MASFIVADVGNSRIKWGLCSEREVTHSASLPLDDAAAWGQQLEAWPDAHRAWILAGVNPRGLGELQTWLAGRTAAPALVVGHAQLELKVRVDHPAQVGIDRLLNAVACNSRRDQQQSGVLVDAGSAVTVDWLDAEGAFRGGAIFPGLRLMAHALHKYTAQLPLLSWQSGRGSMPGMNTEAAIACGIHGAVVGGIRRLATEISMVAGDEPKYWITGGDAERLHPLLPGKWTHWPHMTLEGLRLTALRLL